MTAKILDGKWLSKSLRQKLRERAAILLEGGIQPGLAVVLLGDDPASKVYVNNKVRACEECGVKSFRHAVPLKVPWYEDIWFAVPCNLKCLEAFCEEVCLHEYTPLNGAANALGCHHGSARRFVNGYLPKAWLADPHPSQHFA